MRHIVFITVGITSHLNMCYKIAHQLRRRGFSVTFVSTQMNAASQVEAQGFNAFHLTKMAEMLQRVHHPPKPFANSQVLAGLCRYPVAARVLSLLDRKTRLNTENLRRRYILEENELDSLVEQIKPDLLLIDYELHDVIIGTHKYHIPTVLLEYHCSTRKAPNVPVLYSNFIPAPNRWSSLRVEFGWRQVQFRRWAKHSFWRAYLSQQDWLSTLKALARRDQFDFGQRVDFLKHWQFLTYRDIPTLRLSAWEFDFPHAVSNKEEFVGPMVHLEREEPLADPHYQQVMENLEAKRQADGEKTGALIYCSMGSLISDYAYFKRVIDVFARRRDWTLILAAGVGISPEDFGPLPPNVHLFKRAPQLDALRRADAFLSHGGIGSINEAIMLGTPMVVYSGGAMDENGNAARVAYHRLGLRGNLKRDSSAQIEQKIEAVLSKPDYRANVKKMQQIYLNYHRSDRVVQIIDEAFGETRGQRGF